ncbi:MAG: hypothetical protein ACI4MF_07525, partial [Candidatus Faecivicinus sp.]
MIPFMSQFRKQNSTVYMIYENPNCCKHGRPTKVYLVYEWEQRTRNPKILCLKMGKAKHPFLQAACCRYSSGFSCAMAFFSTGFRKRSETSGTRSSSRSATLRQHPQRNHLRLPILFFQPSRNEIYDLTDGMAYELRAEKMSLRP